MANRSMLLQLRLDYMDTCWRVNALEKVHTKLKQGALTTEERNTIYGKLHGMFTENEVYKTLLDGVAPKEEEDIIWNLYSGAVLEKTNRKKELKELYLPRCHKCGGVVNLKRVSDLWWRRRSL